MFRVRTFHNHNARTTAPNALLYTVTLLCTLIAVSKATTFCGTDFIFIFLMAVQAKITWEA